MRMGKNTEKMPEKDKQRKYKIHEQIKKNHSFNVLKKIWKKEKKLNSVEIDVVINFIKDEYKMGKKEFLKFDEVEIEKVQFHCFKSAIL